MTTKETLGHAWQCGNCCYWIPNGGVLRVGYCRLEKFAYRKEAQSCQHFCPVPKIVLACASAGWTAEQIAREFNLDVEHTKVFLEGQKR